MPNKSTRALKAAFDLHPEVKMEGGKSKEAASPAQLQAWREANRARMSLLQDSWPHKNLAFIRFYGGEIPSDVMSPRDERLIELESIITEEWAEMWEAVFTGDMIELLDGGLDLIYTVLNLLLEHGFQPATINAAYEEIHASNMTKLTSDGKPFIVNGKIQKGELYVPANLREAAAKATPSQDLSAL